MEREEVDCLVAVFHIMITTTMEENERGVVIVIVIVIVFMIMIMVLFFRIKEIIY